MWYNRFMETQSKSAKNTIGCKPFGSGSRTGASNAQRAAALFVFLLLSCSPLAFGEAYGSLYAGSSETAVEVSVGGVFVEGGGVLLGDEGRVVIPLRAVVEYLGGSVRWYPEERQVIGFRGAKGFDLVVGAAQAYLSDGTVCILDAPAMIRDNRTYVPLRFVSEAMGCLVEWDGAAGTVIITTTASEPKREVEALSRPVLLTVSSDKGTGSAFFYARDGQIITCASIIEGASQIMVKTSTGEEYTAEPLIVDSVLNLAKLRAVARAADEAFPVFRYFDDFAGLSAEDTIFALGSPLLADPFVSPGVVRVKTLQDEQRGGINTYTITADITAENDGGALVKENGALVGILCLKAKDENTDAYVIPIEYVFTMQNR